MHPQQSYPNLPKKSIAVPGEGDNFHISNWLAVWDQAGTALQQPCSVSEPSNP